jgi:hypothetical protein
MILLKTFGITTMISILTAGYIFGAGCADYPFSPGDISATETPTGVKILATAAVAVDFDDQDEILDALMEAELEAKTLISKFFTESVTSEQSVETSAMKKIKFSGKTKTAEKEKIKKTLKRISSKSQALLRGVVKLASCYEPGQKVLVSVGLKPETIALAEKATGAIAESVKRQPTAIDSSADNTKSSSESSTGSSAGSSNKGTGSDLNKVDGFSNTKKLDDF